MRSRWLLSVALAVGMVSALAVNAAGTNAVFKDRINREQDGVLLVDLTRRNPRKQTLSQSGTAVFAKRLADFLRLAAAGRKQTAFYSTPMKTLLFDAARIAATNDNAKWAEDKAVKAFLANPPGFISSILTQESLTNGWKILTTGMGGGQIVGEYQRRSNSV